MQTTTQPDPDVLRGAIRSRYGALVSGAPSDHPATAGSSCCSGDSPSGGCGSSTQARTLGYSDAETTGVPDGANLGLGCGNPVALAALSPGQTVLDLGSGAGFDAFLAARAVGTEGRVIGVDMTPEMVTKARALARKGGYAQVEFRLGEIEALPVADASVDVILSNCVINLCPDKAPVYREAFRVLRAGGRLAVSDVVAREPLPPEVAADLALHSGCLAGATVTTDLERILSAAGFVDIAIRPKGNSDEVIGSWKSGRGLASRIFAAEVTARKPDAPCCGPACCGE